MGKATPSASYHLIIIDYSWCRMSDVCLSMDIGLLFSFRWGMVFTIAFVPPLSWIPSTNLWALIIVQEDTDMLLWSLKMMSIALFPHTCKRSPASYPSNEKQMKTGDHQKEWSPEYFPMHQAISIQRQSPSTSSVFPLSYGHNPRSNNTDIS